MRKKDENELGHNDVRLVDEGERKKAKEKLEIKKGRDEGERQKGRFESEIVVNDGN